MASRLLNGRSMRWTCACLLLLLAGCDDGAPPFEELPLRDALRADPSVLAGLSDESRSRLAARFEAARASDRVVDQVQADSALAPATLVLLVDRTRQERQAEPLLLGVIHDGAAWSIDDADPSVRVGSLPPLEGQTAKATAEVEARALAGRAGTELRTLMAASGARHLQRAIGWPVGAIAIGDTIYVNASWLVVLASTESKNLDGGAPQGASPAGVVAPAGHTTVPGSVTDLLDGTATPKDLPPPRGFADAGAPPSTSSSSPESAPVITDDTCNACADSCASCDGESCASDESTDVGDPTGAGYDGGDACSESDDAAGSSDGCDSGDGAAADSCAADSGEMDGGGCQVTPRPRGKRPPLSAWVWAPLGYLFLRRRP